MYVCDIYTRIYTHTQRHYFAYIHTRVHIQVKALFLGSFMQYSLPAVSLSAPGFGSCIHGLRCPHRQWAEEGSLLGSTTLEETQCKSFALCAATTFPNRYLKLSLLSTEKPCALGTSLGPSTSSWAILRNQGSILLQGRFPSPAGVFPEQPLQLLRWYSIELLKKNYC